MNLSQLTQFLQTVDDVVFVLPDNILVPTHFHVTEIGLVDKHFIDCGGTTRHEQSISMQLWVAWDTDHRLTSNTLLKIISMSSGIITDDSLPITLEYQWSTIQTYELSTHGDYLQLIPIMTNCLAQDKCGISPSQIPSSQKSCCGWGCC